ncbi:MAG: electron transfer flavoprotein subunit beta/FixA family protein [Myxococcota bacterium]
MKILVPLKRVADPFNANKVGVSGDGSQVTTEGLEWKMNPYDEYALEAALRLTENAQSKERIGEVVVASIGPKDATQTIRQGLAMGADRGILVEGDDEQLDSWAVAKILKAVVDKEQPDIVLMGKLVVDSESNATGPILADMLGWPQATHAMRLVTQDQGKTVTVGREVDGGVITIKVTGPMVITASDRIIHPEAVKNGVTPGDFQYPEAEGGRYASLKGIMAAKKKKIEETTPDQLGASLDTQQDYKKFEKPPARSGEVEFVETVQELVQKLHTEAKVI